MQHQILRSTCDYCKEHQDFTGQGQLTPDQAEALPNWITLCREFVVNGQVVRVIRHACRLGCAQNILSTGMMELPEPETMPSIPGPMPVPGRA